MSLSNYNESKNHSNNNFNNTIFNINENSNRNDCIVRINSSHIYPGNKCNKMDSLLVNDINENELNENELNINIYRYKFTCNFAQDLYEFSKIHQYDNRDDFKEAWQLWIKDNEEKINTEKERLLRLDFKGDIINKMYKSARYYFRKKPAEKKAPEKQNRITYICISKEILDKMDLHLNQNINNNNFKPKQAYLDFCENNQDILENCMNQIYKDGIKEIQQIKDKIKKTYKNRYFRIISKNK
jgi:hypothetical protein